MKKAFIVSLIALFGSGFIFSQENQKTKKEKKNDKEEATVEVENPEYALATSRIKDNIYMLKGKGGNVGVYIGEEGALIIDSQFEQSAPKILNIVSSLTNKKIQFLINTHHHGDHTGGNKFMHDNEIVTVAHKNVREIMINNEKKKIQAKLDVAYDYAVSEAISKGASEKEAEKSGLEAVQRMVDEQVNVPNSPKLVFEDQLNLYFNKEDVSIFHLHNAHTQGDAVVYFVNSNVMHTGDTFVNGKYPFIDTENGGTYSGYLRGLKKLLMMMNEDTVIIPGHGPKATKKDVQYTESLMRYIIPKIQYHVVAGKTLEEILAMKETKKWDDQGFGAGFITTEKFVTGIYNSFKKEKEEEQEDSRRKN